MKIARLAVILWMACFCLSGMAYGDNISELLDIDSELVNIAGQDVADTAALESELRARENILFSSVINSSEDIERLIPALASTGSGLDERFKSRLRFEIGQEHRKDLQILLDKIQGMEEGPSASVRGKKIAYIYGCEVNLRDGQWHTAPDGRRFWVSNEYPDIVLSPAEYKRYLASATDVDY
ncbi:MAG: hypothetical protein CVV42_10605 [Candidatus Riflebacteria bacterium HGW-Riflebacteria-2]|jgi:hypothetical protein|nr:MAG: hypothetical protein CVV42_10605 [Candidatus Riflebacteria bacterium HGW-Riflebacteria-2]